MAATRPGVHGLQRFDVDPFFQLLHLFTIDVGSQELLKSGHLLVKVGFQVLVPHEVDVGVAPFGPSSLEILNNFWDNFLKVLIKILENYQALLW